MSNNVCKLYSWRHCQGWVVWALQLGIMNVFFFFFAKQSRYNVDQTSFEKHIPVPKVDNIEKNDLWPVTKSFGCLL